jgi:type I restriction enzyme M protein
MGGTIAQSPVCQPASHPGYTCEQQACERDVLGRIYGYFIGKFASFEGKSGGEFYTPSCLVRLLVEMIKPYKGRVYDRCCGSGGMFVQSEKLVEAHGSQRHDLTIYGQELNHNAWCLCKMNLAIRGLEENLGPQWAEVFHKDHHPDLKADFILLSGDLRLPAATQLLGHTS